MTRWHVWLAFTAGLPVAVTAQDTTAARPPAASLTLAEALSTARANSPVYRQTLNDVGPARWGVRSAYGALLPQADASLGFGYTGSGRSSFGGTTFSQTSPSYNSSYSLGLQMQINGRTLSGLSQVKALARATDADIWRAASSSGSPSPPSISRRFRPTRRWAWPGSRSAATRTS